MWIFSLRNNYELTVLLYCIRTGINNLLMNQATQVYVITTNQFNLPNDMSWPLQYLSTTILDSVYQ